MSQQKFLVPALGALFLLAIPVAQAQVEVDVAKITCEQYVLFKVADPRDISLWLSGYYHGKQGSTLVDIARLKEESEAVKRHCQSNPKMLVIQAIETVLGPGPK